MHISAVTSALTSVVTKIIIDLHPSIYIAGGPTRSAKGRFKRAQRVGQEEPEEESKHPVDGGPAIVVS